MCKSKGTGDSLAAGVQNCGDVSYDYAAIAVSSVCGQSMKSNAISALPMNQAMLRRRKEQTFKLLMVLLTVDSNESQVWSVIC